jgi:hypothetical protein
MAGRVGVTRADDPVDIIENLRGSGRRPNQQKLFVVHEINA